MTIREELEILGPERVRRGMVAFDHREIDPENNFGCNHGICCFLSHAMTGWILSDRAELGAEPGQRPPIEQAFENQEGAPMSRAVLRAECIAFLAEHGDAKEITPVREVVSGSAVVQQERGRAVVDSEALQNVSR